MDTVHLLLIKFCPFSLFAFSAFLPLKHEQKLAQEHLLIIICALPHLSLLMEPQHLELLVVLVIEDLPPRLSLEPGLQPTKLPKLLQLQLPRSLNLNRLHQLLHQEELPQLKLPVLHWQLPNPSMSFPLHLLQMGNALWCLWEGERGFPPSASWMGRTTPSRPILLLGPLLMWRRRRRRKISLRCFVILVSMLCPIYTPHHRQK